MEATHVNVARRTAPPRTLEEDLQTARTLATLLDAQFEIGKFRIGVDALIGLIPIVGDLASTAAGAYLIHVARKHKLGKWVQMKMAGNLMLDMAAGSVPLAGDVFDAVYKANLKNLELLEKAAQKKLRA
jgi:hypothetical protein